MSSRSLALWRTTRQASLDEIEAAHRSVGGVGPGRRHTTQQLNYAYTLLLSAQFQGYCRDFHSECAEFLVAAIASPRLREACLEAFVVGRKLDQGNPHAATLGADFNRLGIDFWDEVRASGPRNADRKDRIDLLNRWRNAIAHHDFDRLGTDRLRVRTVRRWRQSCDHLARVFDKVMQGYVVAVTGKPPW